MVADSERLRQLLVETIERELRHPLEPEVRRAFLAIERHRFVPRYYIQQGRRWIARDAGPEVYENRFFFTRLDERGVPNSSSSQPSLMAPMLEALSLSPGQRVLEIGTGTGYNAALLGEMVGETGRVVTVDIAPDLVKSAAARLREMPWVETVVADGLSGYAPRAPYDRIIATGGAATIPRAWLEQLTTGGILVGSLRRSGAPTPLYRLVKQEDGSARGQLLPDPAFFMEFYQENQPPKRPIDWTLYEAMEVLEQDQTPLNMPLLLKDPGFWLFVELRLPGLEAHLRYLGSGSPLEANSYGTSLMLPGRAMLTFVRSAEHPLWRVEVRGQERLWTHLFNAYTEWEKQGRPVLSCYRIMVEPNASYHLQLSDDESNR